MSIFNFSAQTMYCWASVNTIQSHATTMSLMNGPFDVLFKLLACKTVNNFEKFGTYIILIGILIMLFDPNAKRVGEEQNVTVELISLTGNLAGIAFWRIMNGLKNEISLWVLIFGFACGNSFWQGLIACLFEDATFEITDVGLFGFFRKDIFIPCFFGLGFLAGFIPYAGYIFCLNHFSL